MTRAGILTPVRTRTFLKLLALPLALAIAGVVTLVVEPGTPEPLTELRRAQELTGTAQERSEAIAEALEDIASNLETGATFEARSDEIHDLTTRQRRSLQEVVGILREQLSALQRSERELEQTEETTSDIARLSRSQAAAVERSVAALRRLEGAAAQAGRFSALVARRARYSARLAEDSQEAFEGP